MLGRLAGTLISYCVPAAEENAKHADAAREGAEVLKGQLKRAEEAGREAAERKGQAEEAKKLLGELRELEERLARAEQVIRLAPSICPESASFKSIRRRFSLMDPGIGRCDSRRAGCSNRAVCRFAALGFVERGRQLMDSVADQPPTPEF